MLDYYFFKDRVSLCIPGWNWTHSLCGSAEGDCLSSLSSEPWNPKAHTCLQNPDPASGNGLQGGCTKPRPWSHWLFSGLIFPASCPLPWPSLCILGPGGSYPFAPHCGDRHCSHAVLLETKQESHWNPKCKTGIPRSRSLFLGVD